MYDKEVRDSQMFGIEKALHKTNERIIEIDREQNRIDNKI